MINGMGPNLSDEEIQIAFDKGQGDGWSNEWPNPIDGVASYFSMELLERGIE